MDGQVSEKRRCSVSVEVCMIAEASPRKGYSCKGLPQVKPAGNVNTRWSHSTGEQVSARFVTLLGQFYAQALSKGVL